MLGMRLRNLLGSLHSVLFALPLFVGVGCTDDLPDDAPDSGGGTGDDMCPVCDADEEVFGCCTPGTDNCVQECLADDGSEDCPAPTSAPIGRTVCDNSVSETNGKTWKPSDFVSFNSQTQTYEIGQTAWDGILQHPGQLLHDGARVEPTPSGYRFTGIMPGDFFGSSEEFRGSRTRIRGSTGAAAWR